MVGKLPAYRRVRDSGGPSWPVLFVLRSWLRERNLRQRLAVTGTSGMIVATSSQGLADADPAGPIWSLAGDTGLLRDGGWWNCRPGRGRPAHPSRGAVTPEQDPLRLLDHK